jgi:hypothetical protein
MDQVTERWPDLGRKFLRSPLCGVEVLTDGVWTGGWSLSPQLAQVAPASGREGCGFDSTFISKDN